MPAPNQRPLAPLGALPNETLTKLVPMATAPLAASSAAAIGAAGAGWAMWLGWSSVWLSSGRTLMACAAHEAPKAAMPAPVKMPVAAKEPAAATKRPAPVKRALEKAAKPKPAASRPAPQAKSAPTPAPVASPKPEAAPVPDAPAATAAAKLTTTRPMALDTPKHGKADDLKLISGVGPKLEIVLNDLGVYHFDQIAGWTKTEIDWVDDYLSFSGRIERDDWVAQAKALAAGTS